MISPAVWSAVQIFDLGHGAHAIAPRNLFRFGANRYATHYYPNCCRDWRWLHEEIHIENFVFDIDIFNCFYDKCKITAPSVKM